MTRVGIVIPTLGTRLDWLRCCIDSIVRQPFVDIELLLVTPNSRDVEGVAGARGARVLHSETPGISAAVTEGWATLRDCEYLAWLGDDDLLAPNSLAAGVRHMEENPSCAATYGSVRYIDGASKTLFLARPGRIAGTYLPWGKDLVPQPGSLFRRTAVDEVGGLDCSLRYAMDYDLFIRLREVGGLAYLPIEVAAFRLHPASITGSNRSGDEADAVRARVHSANVNRLRRALRPMTHILDRALYKALQRPGGAVPMLDGQPYVSSPCGEG